MDQKPLTRYACDYCWKKKLRCSREKPKCKNCSCWTSDCVYSREPSESAHLTTKSQSSSTPPVLTPSHNSKSAYTPPPLQSQSQRPRVHPALDLGDDTSPSISSTFSHAQKVLDRNQMNSDFTEITEQGTGMLSELCEGFRTSTYDFDKIKAAVRKMRREKEPFFIPTEPVGQLFVQSELPSSRDVATC